MQRLNANNCLNSDIWLKNNSQNEYGCHTPDLTNNLRQKRCIHCHQWTPSSLEELAFSVMLENEDQMEIESIFGHLPHRICWLVGRALNAGLLDETWPLTEVVSEYGETRPSWYDVDQNRIIFLLRFRLFCEANEKLKGYERYQSSAGIDEIVQYISDVNNTYEDFWSKMASGMKKLKAETEGPGYFQPLKSIIYAGSCFFRPAFLQVGRTSLLPDLANNFEEMDGACNLVYHTVVNVWSKITSLIAHLMTDYRDYFVPWKISEDENNVVLMKATEVTTDGVLSRDEYKSMKELQRLNKTFDCPVVFKPTMIGLIDLESRDIKHLLDYIDPKVISDVDLTKSPAWSVADIDELGRVLSACNNLSSIYLRQESISTEVLEGMAAAVSRLFSHHHQLQKIGLISFNLAETLTTYPLRPVETLRLRQCTFTDEDWNFMANRSDMALKTLVVNSDLNRNHFPSLSIFIQSHAQTLEDLELNYPTVSLIEICELLTVMAKFNKLQVFYLNCLVEIDFVSIENLIVHLMSIESTRRVFIEFPTNCDSSEIEAETNRLRELQKELCQINRRPPIRIDLRMVLTN